MAKKKIISNNAQSKKKARAKYVKDGEEPKSIAYKIPTSKIYNLINTDPINVALQTISGNPTGGTLAYAKILIGLQFRFKKNATTSFDYISIYKVYFNYTTYFSISNQPDLELDLSNEIFYVNKFIENSPIDDTILLKPKLSHFSLENNPINVSPINIYKKLDFFKDQNKVELVYFAIGELLPLISIYENLIISGCQLKLGKKLTKNHLDKDKLYKELYFSLKIEGGDLKASAQGLFKKSPNNTKGSSNEVGGAISLVGYPCPPVWQTYSSLIGDALKLKPQLLSSNKYQDLYHSVKRVSYIKPQA